ncbi:MAG: U-box domain-containing protein, partial [Actinomycetota bacterium]|nr:U-box domain-containing protein [Actinomycetota bacterium]
ALEIVHASDVRIVECIMTFVTTAGYYDRSEFEDAVMLVSDLVLIASIKGASWRDARWRRAVFEPLTTWMRANSSLRSVVRPGELMRRAYSNGWPPECAPFVVELLRGDIRLIVCLLQMPEIYAAFQMQVEQDGSWNIVDLKRAYPSEWSSPVTRCTCPITLQAMQRPVVASDGHTYERRALIDHIVRNGAVSPVTRQRISYDVYSNYAVVTE